jgi:hypothetical protein
MCKEQKLFLSLLFNRILCSLTFGLPSVAQNSTFLTVWLYFQILVSDVVFCSCPIAHATNHAYPPCAPEKDGKVCGLTPDIFS